MTNTKKPSLSASRVRRSPVENQADELEKALESQTPDEKLEIEALAPEPEVPEAAAVPEPKPDPTKIAPRQKAGKTFENFDPMDSDDVKATLEKLVEERLAALVNQNAAQNFGTPAAPAIPETAPVAVAQNEAMMNDRDGMPEPAMFTSKFPALALYVHVGSHQVGQHGEQRRIETRVDFVQGVFRTRSPAVAEALRAHRNFGTVFQEAQTLDQAAMREVIEQQRQSLRASHEMGAATSSAGNDAVFQQRSRVLDKAENGLF